MQDQNLKNKITSIKNELFNHAEKYAIFYSKVLVNVDITSDEEAYKQKIKEMREGKIPEGFPLIDHPEFQKILIDQQEKSYKLEIETRREAFKILHEDQEANEKWMQLLREMNEAIDQLQRVAENK